MFELKKVLVAGAMVLGLAAGSASAVGITGSISFSGGWVPTGGGGGIVGATGIDFSGDAFIVAAPAPTLDLSVFPVGSTGTINDFTFAPFVGPFGLYTITVGPNTLSFSLTSISIDLQNASFLNLSGLGTMSLTGKDPTPGTWNFSGQTAGGGTFSWSASSFVQTTPVPEPATLLLIGTALAGLGFARRKHA